MTNPQARRLSLSFVIERSEVICHAAKYKAIDPTTLNAEQRQAHKNAIRNFVLGGAELTGPAKERFAAIQERQAELTQKFSEHALDATDAYAYYASEGELAGVPQDVV